MSSESSCKVYVLALELEKIYGKNYQLMQLYSTAQFPVAYLEFESRERLYFLKGRNGDWLRWMVGISWVELNGLSKHGFVQHVKIMEFLLWTKKSSEKVAPSRPRNVKADTSLTIYTFSIKSSKTFGWIYLVKLCTELSKKWHESFWSPNECWNQLNFWKGIKIFSQKYLVKKYILRLWTQKFWSFSIPTCLILDEEIWNGKCGS